MICPICKTEISDENTETCPECKVDIRKFFDVQKKYPWVQVYTTNTELDAEMFKANLESAGIPVQILKQIDSTRMFTVGVLAIVKIFVPSPFITEAEDIIHAIDSGNFDDEGEENDADKRDV